MTTNVPKLLTLTINPAPPVVPPQQATTTIPHFQYIPIPPIITAPVSTQNFDPNNKEAIRAQKNREHQRRHAEKVKPFQQLATIDNPEERLAALILLSHPEFAGLPKYVLHQETDVFIRSLRAKYIK
ncbi:Hypothetical protein HVR_LOCUS868 [uncultured virus]|nr:Hypothetical protein HVR_LOCUS868 [uncultured virus]